MTQGDKVIIRCPVYKNGKKFTGVVSKMFAPEKIWNGTLVERANVIIDGNSKSTKFATNWLTIIK